MTLVDLMRRSARRNLSLYFTYVISLAVDVAVFYVFTSIFLEPQSRALSVSYDKMRSMFRSCAVIVLVFSVAFTWYATSFFLKRRKREAATYALLGMERRRVGALLFAENMVMGIVALVAGIAFGVLFSRFFSMALIFLMKETAAIAFSVVPGALLWTAVAFAAIFLANSLHAWSLPYRFSLVELFRAERQGDRAPRPKAIVSVLAAALILAGYALALFSPSGSIANLALPILFLVVTGTYLIFGSLVVRIVRRLTRKKDLYYAGPNLVAISQLAYRIQRNSRMLATIAVLSAVTLTAVGTTVALYAFAGKITDRLCPNAYELLDAETSIEASLTDAIGRARGFGLVSRDSLPLIKTDVDIPALASPDGKPRKVRLAVVSYADYRRTALRLGYDLLPAPAAGEAVSLDSGVAIAAGGSKSGSINVPFAGKAFSLRFMPGPSPSILSFQNAQAVIVLSDADFAAVSTRFPARRLLMLEVSPRERSGSLTAQLGKIAGTGLVAYSDAYADTIATSGITIFIGIFLGIVFFLAACSVISFKQLIDAADDAPRYRILRNVGISRADERSSIAIQLRVVFGLPLAFGILHSSVALQMAGQLFRVNILVPVAVVACLYALFYYLFYRATTAGYLRALERPAAG